MSFDWSGLRAELVIVDLTLLVMGWEIFVKEAERFLTSLCIGGLALAAWYLRGNLALREARIVVSQYSPAILL